MADGPVRTLFLGGLPEDCTERELQLLFFDAYHQSQSVEGVRLVHPPPGSAPGTRKAQKTAFVQFVSPERAHAAAAAVHGMQFDAGDPSGAPLRAELAKQNMRPAALDSPRGTKRPHEQAFRQMHLSIQPPPYDSRTPQPATYMGGAGTGGGAGGSSTLFLGGLGALVTRADLEAYAAQYEGFVAVKMKGEGTEKAAGWAQYASPELAAVAHHSASVTPLASSGRVPNVEMARSDMNRSQAAVGVQQWQHPEPAAMPLLAAPSVPPPRAGAAAGGSTTVFIGELARAVTEEEITEYAASQVGYVGIKCKGMGQPRACAWATYDSPASALTAANELPKYTVPSMPDRGPNVELARKNTGEAKGHAPHSVPQRDMARHVTVRLPPGGGGYVPLQRHLAAPHVPPHAAAMVPPPSAPAAGTSCTLFIGSIDVAVTQADLDAYCGQAPGLVKVTAKGIGQPRAVAWAQFQTPDEALGAVEQLRHCALHPMGTAPNIELAKANSRSR